MDFTWKNFDRWTNRLKGLACYLSGPMDFAADQGAGWRDDITPFLQQKDVFVFNPLKHVFAGTSDTDTVKRKRMDEYKSDGNWDAYREEMKDINHWDLRALDLSSFVIVNYDVNTFMCGTHEEVFVANRQQKPVLLVLTEPKEKLPSWMLGRFPSEHMFDSWDELRLYIDDIDRNPDLVLSKADERRWLFYEDGLSPKDVYSRDGID